MKARVFHSAMVLMIAFAVVVAVAPAGAVQAQVIRYVNPDGTCGGSFPCYTTIQAAVNAASAGDTIIVAAATYNEKVIVCKSLTLKGANAGKSAGTDPETRGAESLVTGGIAICCGANYVVVNGFQISISPGNPASGVYITGGTVGHVICNNVLDGPGTAIAVRGIELGSNTQNIAVRDNEITEWKSGIYVGPSANNALTVEGNNFHGNDSAIGSDGLNNATVQYNKFTGNTEGWGHSDVGHAGGNNLQAHNNDFVGNAWGIYNYDTDGQIIDATNNWWSDPHGPTDDSDDRATGGWYNPGDITDGDPVSDYVKYEPWLAVSYETSQGCFIATAAYGSYMDTSVETLRAFRDHYLIPDPAGRSLVAAYYELSPHVARFIDSHPALKPPVRAALLPAVSLSKAAVSTAPAAKTAIACTMIVVSTFALFWLRRRALPARHAGPSRIESQRASEEKRARFDLPRDS